MERVSRHGLGFGNAPGNANAAFLKRALAVLLRPTYLTGKRWLSRSSGPEACAELANPSNFSRYDGTQCHAMG